MGWKVRLTISLVILLFIPMHNANAGDWMLSKGSAKMGMGYSILSSDRYWDENSELQKDDCSSLDHSLGIRYEYGYTYHKTLFASTSLRSKTCGDEKVTGVSSFKMGVRGRINPFRNGHTWEVSAIIPVEKDKFEDSKSDAKEYGIELGLFRTYRPDPYKFAFMENNPGVFGWAVGVNLWNEDIGHQGWVQGNWRKKLSDEYSIKATLGGRTIISDVDETDTLSNDYDVVNASFRLSRKFDEESRMGISLRQDVWGRDTSRDTTLQVTYQVSWD